MKTDKPAHDRYAAHVLVCRAAEHGSWNCQQCRWLEADANAEMFKRWVDRVREPVQV